MHTSDIVTWILICIFLTIIIARHFLQTHNNSCKTSSDYYSYVDKNIECYYNPDLDLTVPGIIRRYGYEVETYEVATDDHYILKVYRIVKKKNNGAKYQPVYFQHGLFQNSIAFLLKGNKSLPFTLADAGYDVWLGNFRGTHYSTHTYLSRKDSKFWDYSLDEYVSYDVSSLIDLVYEETQQKIIYVGFSFGATAAYVYSARFPEIAQSKIHLIVSLGPTVHPKEWRSENRHIFSNWNYISPVVSFMTAGSIDIRTFGYFDWSALCLPFPFQMRLCEIATKLTYDFSLDNISPEYWPLILMKTFDVVSMKSINHLSQIVVNGEFRSYDYGDEQNRKRYINSNPASVDLSQVKIPTYIIRAANDTMSTKINVEFLFSTLPREATRFPIYVIKNSNFTQGDLLWHTDVSAFVNNPLIKFLDKFLTDIKE